MGIRQVGRKSIPLQRGRRKGRNQELSSRYLHHGRQGRLGTDHERSGRNRFGGREQATIRAGRLCPGRIVGGFFLGHGAVPGTESRRAGHLPAGQRAEERLGQERRQQGCCRQFCG